MKRIIVLLMAFVVLVSCSDLKNPAGPSQKSGISFRFPVPAKVRPDSKVLSKAVGGYEQFIVSATSSSGSVFSTTIYPEQGYVSGNLELPPGHYSVLVTYQIDFKDRYRSLNIDVDIIIGQVTQVTVIMYQVKETGMLDFSVFWDETGIFFPDTTYVVSLPDSISYLLFEEGAVLGVNLSYEETVLVNELDYQFVNGGGEIGEVGIRVHTSYFNIAPQNVFKSFMLQDENGTVIATSTAPDMNGVYNFSGPAIQKSSGEKGKLLVYGTVSHPLNNSGFDFIQVPIVSLSFSGPERTLGSLPRGPWHTVSPINGG